MTYVCKCQQCKQHLEDHEMVILPNKLWLTIADTMELICVKCIEQRLGRNLRPRDFPDKQVRVYRGQFENVKQINCNKWYFRYRGWPHGKITD
jgi:hypothetical protein